MEKQSPTVGFSTYENIKRDIIFGRLSPSSKLKLGELKTQYSASVSTLREILNRLASEGFVVAEEQRGFFVAPISEADFRDIANLRILLEGHALKESIENGDTEWEGNLVAAYHKLKRMEELMLSGEFSEKEQWKRYDFEFHKASIQACRSKNLLILHAPVYDKYLRYQMLVLTFRGESAAGEHKELLDAALNRDVDAAQQILHDHVELGLKHALSAFS